MEQVGADEPAVVQGPPGKSAYELWLAAGNTGTEAQWLASLQGQTPSTSEVATAVQTVAVTAEAASD